MYSYVHLWKKLHNWKRNKDKTIFENFKNCIVEKEKCFTLQICEDQNCKSKIKNKRSNKNVINK